MMADGQNELPRKEIAVENDETEVFMMPAESGMMKDLAKRLGDFYRNVMEKGTDYDTLKGTRKPTLLKPGAEFLQKGFGMSSRITQIEKVERTDPDHPFFMYTVTLAILDRSGKFITDGAGSANTGETRYAFRWLSENRLPPGVSKESLQSRMSEGQYGSYREYRLPSSPDEIFSLANTVLKMVKKRALVDGILGATGASRIFTQDVEDMMDAGEPNSAEKNHREQASHGNEGEQSSPKLLSDKQKAALDRYAKGNGKHHAVLGLRLSKLGREIPELTSQEASSILEDLFGMKQEDLKPEDILASMPGFRYENGVIRHGITPPTVDDELVLAKGGWLWDEERKGYAAAGKKRVGN